MSFGLNEHRSPHDAGFGYALNGTPFVCSLAATTGINPDVILIISNICSGYAFWTVAASTNAAFILGRPEITPKFVWTKGVQTTVLFMVICYICGMAFTYIL